MLSVEEVEGKDAYRRFVELPFGLYGSEPRWAPPVMAGERARLDPRTNPALGGDVRYLLARRRGRPAGRLLVLGDGRFACFDADDEDTAADLFAAVGDAAVGPDAVGEEQAGVLVAGFEAAGVTGRQWHPPVYAAALEGAGFRRVDERPMWRLPATASRPAPAPGGAAPTVAGVYRDPRLVFRDIAAVPDVAPVLRAARPGRAWSIARQARRREWEGCTIVRLDGEPADLVPALVSAAAEAGYRWVVAPWTPEERAPETVHAVYGRP